jgi:hypothetical protein
MGVAVCCAQISQAAVECEQGCDGLSVVADECLLLLTSNSRHIFTAPLRMYSMLSFVAAWSGGGTC